ncbi:MAG: S8 family serine peptidase [Nostoc sp.]|uniref:S8 family serine peptidase n=1 Tax=Nostoc sp. TaxID=1180 RepID=UPI002FFB5682
MSLFGFGGKKGQNAKKSKKSKPREVWQGKSFALDDIITPSVFVGGGENSPDPFLIDLHTLPGSEIDLSQSNLLQALDPNSLELLNQPHLSLLDHQTMSDWLVDPSYQPLPFFDNPGVSTNSFTENVSILHSSDTCPVDSPPPGSGTHPGVTAGTSGWPNFELPDVNSTLPILPFDPLGTDKPPKYNFKKSDQPLIGVIDTGFNAKNPDIDYSRVKLGKDLVDNDKNPLLADGEGSEHGTHVLGIIGATEGNGIGIDGINDQAPIWVGRAIGSGKWAESLKEFVDEFKTSGQPNGVVNLSFDLTQTNPDGSVTTRYELTPQEREALEYARQNGVIVVVAAGNDGGTMSALGQASQEFDNIITVGAADELDRADYSSYGEGLDIVAAGGTNEKPVVSSTGDGVGTMAGTSVAAAQVTGAASQVWAANPQLSYRQVIEILKSTATDLKTPGWDAETGAGLLNIAEAVSVAGKTTPEVYNPEAFLTPTTWGGEGQVTSSERAVSVEFNGKYYDWESYKIRSGDTLSGIALRTMGNGTAPYYNFIAQRNGIANPSYIYTGQTIYVPKQVASPTVNLNNTVGYDGNSTHQTYINTFNRNGGSSVLGSANNNVHPWGNGYTQDFSGGSEGNGAIMKSNANDNSFWVGADFWTKFWDTGASGGILGYPTSDRYSTNGGQRQNFQGGAIIKSSQGIFPLFGAIGAHYLNNEGGEKGRLGFPTSGEIGIGNGVIVQNFQNGRIVFNDGPTRTEINNQPVSPPTSTTVNGYRVDGNFYPVYTNYRGTVGNPISGVINYSNGVTYQLFDRGSIVSSQYGTYPIFGGIRQTYLNTGGLNGWLGAPKSAEIGQGNGVVIQYFANGYIIWNGSKATAYRNGSGMPSQPVPNPKPDNSIKLKNFRGWVMPGIGVALRNSPHLNDKSGKAEAYGKWLEFDAWTYGDTVNDYKVGTPDNRWFRIKGTNYWVPSAYIYGNPEGLPGIETPGSSSSGSNNNQPITTYADYLKRLYGGNSGVITQRPSSDHNAIDSVNQGSAPYKVYSLTSGVVKYIGKDQYGGNYIQIWNPELQRYFYYVHFANFNPALKVGQQIKAGDYIGNEGSTGNSTGRHTHVHVTLPDGKTKVDPLSVLSQNSGNSGGNSSIGGGIDNIDFDNIQLSFHYPVESVAEGEIFFIGNYAITIVDDKFDATGSISGDNNKISVTESSLELSTGKIQIERYLDILLSPNFEISNGKLVFKLGNKSGGFQTSVEASPGGNGVKGEFTFNASNEGKESSNGITTKYEFSYEAKMNYHIIWEKYAYEQVKDFVNGVVYLGTPYPVTLIAAIAIIAAGAAAAGVGAAQAAAQAAAGAKFSVLLKDGFVYLLYSY